MTRGAIARHVDILAVGVVLACYGAFVTAQSGIEHMRAYRQQGRTTLQRLEHHRRFEPSRIAIDARRWLRRA